MTFVAIGALRVKHGRLTICLVGDYACFFNRLLTCFDENSFWNTISGTNSFDPDQGRPFVEPGRSPNRFVKFISR